MWEEFDKFNSIFLPVFQAEKIASASFALDLDSSNAAGPDDLASRLHGSIVSGRSFVPLRVISDDSRFLERSRPLPDSPASNVAATALRRASVVSA